MAKSRLPLPTGNSTAKKLLVTVVLIALVAVVVRYPADAASAAIGVGRAASAVVDGFATFFRVLAN
ncbi:MAG: hypothetical protein WBA97_09875 [Actinophytocola sp.]|uniref:hypothetical protein n=1 Tax=Actinophytocola sp. TaxID=1872138 RepID=UPI003C7372A3